MASSGLRTALTLYRSGTFTLSQAATRAGLREEEFAAQARRHGVEPATDAAAPERTGGRTAGAD